MICSDDSSRCEVVVVKHGGADCCVPGSQASRAVLHASDCGCGCGIPRRFISSAEKLEKLEAYKDNLANELSGVEEAIRDFKEDS